MRTATHDTQWLLAANGQLQGIALGWDFVSEHEWGIKGIKEAFGVPDIKFPMGIEARQIGGLPDTLITYTEFKHVPGHDKRGKKVPFAILAYSNVGDWHKDPAGYLKETALRNAQPYDWRDQIKNLGAAWSDRDFAIVVKGETDIAYLRELKAAFERNDIAIAPGKGHGFMRSHGLTFVIISRLEPEVFTTVLAADKDYKRLIETSEGTGIQKRLKDAKLGYYCLSPSWANEEKTAIHFWLNPMEQHQYNACWATVQDLEDWIAGKGKIIKVKEEKQS